MAPPPCHRYARARFDAVRIGQRTGQGRRGRPANRRVSAGGPHRRPVDRTGRRHAAARRPAHGTQVARPHLGHARGTPRRRSPARATPTPTPRSRRTSCTAVRRPTRSPTRSTSTSTSARCRARRREDVDHHLREALGDLYDQVEFSVLQHSDPTRCEFGPGNAAVGHADDAHPDRLSERQAHPRPDRRRHRRPVLPRSAARSPTAPACSRPEMDFASFGTRFHGNDERIDTASLGLSANYFYGIAKELLS